jgi:hypothetical protein
MLFITYLLLMPPLNDRLVDELRDHEGRLRSLNLKPLWLKPKTVSLHDGKAPSTGLSEAIDLRHIARSSKCGAELTFVIPIPDPTSGRGPYVRRDPHLLEQFLCLADASDSDIHSFASQFGALHIFCRKEKSESKDQVVITESCNVWRYFARSMRSILRIGARFYAGQIPHPGDWDAIANCPKLIEQAGEEEEFEPKVDILSPMPLSGEYGWRTIVYFLRIPRIRNRKNWARLLNAMLDLGRTRPWVVWDRYAATTPPQLVFAGPGLLSYLALQVCLTALKLDSLVVCSYCNKQYPPPRRAPKSGQRNFCDECRKKRVPVRMAVRDLRARRRGEGN